MNNPWKITFDQLLMNAHVLINRRLELNADLDTDLLDEPADLCREGGHFEGEIVPVSMCAESGCPGFTECWGEENAELLGIGHANP